MLLTVKNNVWRSVAISLGIVVLGCFIFGVVRNRGTRKEAEIPATPEPVALNANFEDPVDFENVPVFKEIGTFRDIAIKRPLAPSELERVIVILETVQHPLSQLRGHAILRSVDVTPHQKRIVDLAIKLTKSPDSNVRSSAITLLQKFGSKEHADIIVPFLESKKPEEAESARRALRHFGYDVPERPVKD